MMDANAMPLATGAVFGELAAGRSGGAESELLSQLPAAIFTCDVGGQLTFYNSAAVELWGRQPDPGRDRWTGAHRMYTTDGIPLSLDECPTARVLRGLTPGSEPLIVERPDGTRRCVLPYPRPLRDASGLLIGTLTMLIDVTEQREAAVAKLETEQRLARMIDLLPAAVYGCDAAGRLTFYNQRAVEAWGYEPPLHSDAVRFCGFARIQVDSGEPMLPEACPMADAVRNGVSLHDVESFVDRVDGKRLRVRANIEALRDAHGNPAGAINVFHDVSHRVRLENDARRLAAIVTSSQDAIMAIDLDGSISSWNRGAELLFGYTQEEILGQHVGILCPPGDDAEPPVPEQIRDGPKFYEAVRQAKDGTLCDVSVTVSPVLDDQGSIRGISKIIRDIGHLRRIEAKLREEARRKSEFLATLSHELRNPLAPLRNGLEILQMTEGMPPETSSTIRMMERQLQHMVHLIDDLLDISRINQGKLRLKKEMVSIAEAVRTAVEACQPLINKHGHELALKLPDQAMHVEADPDRLAQVFSNLLSNAAKYTPTGGHLRLAVTQRAAEVEVAVSDDGVGIPPERLMEIFELFTQVDAGSEAAQGGLGIGLTLVRKLVEMQGGKVEAHSKGLGHGSTFIVRLPRVKVTHESRNGTRADARVSDRSQHRILVVDDNKDAATTLACVLEMLGHEVSTAHDGEEAVETAVSLRPDLILMDIGMPKLDGYEACRIIRQRLPEDTLTIVALTGWGQDEDRQQSKHAGFNHHLVKPVHMPALREIIARLDSN